MKTSGIVAAGLALLLSLPVMGCNGLDADSFGPTQALTATGDIFQAMAASSVSSGYARQAALTVAAGIRNARPSESPIAPSLASPSIAPEATTSTTIPTFTYKCPAGGTIVVTGSYTGAASSATINVLETINGCTDSGITFNGNPNVDVTGSITEAGNIYTEAVTITGSFTTSSNENCSISVAINATDNATTSAVNGTISGTVCGITISSTLQ